MRSPSTRQYIDMWNSCVLRRACSSVARRLNIGLDAMNSRSLVSFSSSSFCSATTLSSCCCISLLFLFSSSLSAQGFYGSGVTGLASTSPKPSSWLAVASLASARAQIWDIAEVDYQAVRPIPGPVLLQSSIRLAVATPFRSFGRVSIYALADAGMASSGPSVGGAYGAGVVATIRFRGDAVLILGEQALRTPISGTTQIWRIGFGWLTH